MKVREIKGRSCMHSAEANPDEKLYIPCLCTSPHFLGGPRSLARFLGANPLGASALKKASCLHYLLDCQLLRFVAHWAISHFAPASWNCAGRSPDHRLNTRTLLCRPIITSYIWIWTTIPSTICLELVGSAHALPALHKVESRQPASLRQPTCGQRRRGSRCGLAKQAETSATALSALYHQRQALISSFRLVEKARRGVIQNSKT